MKCTDASEQLIDLLYGELSTEARVQLEAHLAECPGCADEAKSLGHTAQVARAALAGPLSEEPPSRVRASILQAAEAAVPRRQVRPATEGNCRWEPGRVPMPSCEVSRPAKPDDSTPDRRWEPGRVPMPSCEVSRPAKPDDSTRTWLARWLRLPWLFPAVGAFGVAAVILLVKVVKDPQLPAPMSAAKESTESSAPAAPALPEVTVMPARPAAQPASSPVRTTSPEPSAPASEKADRADRAEKTKRMAIAARPAPAKTAPSEEVREGEMALGGLADRAGGSGANWASPPPAAKPKASVDEFEALGSLAGRAAERRRGDDRKAPAPVAAAPAGPARNMAPPPPAPAPAMAPAPAPAAFAPAPSPMSAEAPAVARGAKRPMAKDDAPKPQAAEDFDNEAMRSPESTESPESTDKMNKKAEASPRREAKGGAGDLDDRIRTADRLFAKKRWGEALLAYRALLLRAPDHPLARTWRERVAVAEHAPSEATKPAASPAPPR